MEVQIVIKAPNQNVGEDHVVNCNLEWTVQQLKEHLSKTYPTKPKVKEQKLIYSGHLLLNHLCLKDILRQEDNDSSVHILHLVCNSDSSFVQQPSQTWTLPVSRPLLSGQSTSGTVRQRNVTSMPPSNAIFPQNLAPQATIPVFMPDSQMVDQYAAMQQMYAYYFSQYIQSTYNPGIVPGYNPPLQGAATYQAPANEAPAPNVQELQLPPEVADEILNRDWLDHAFQCCRFVLLFMLLYCYSTPERLGIVLFCAGVAVMYQEGWFQFLRRPPLAAPAEFVPPQDVPNVADLPGFENGDEEPMLVNPDFDAIDDDNFGEYEIEATMDGDDPPHAHPHSDDANNNHIFSPLTFLSAFFSSLIPDPPPAPININ